MIDNMEHKTVFKVEAVEWLLGGKNRGIFVDGTTGHGGHTCEILKRLVDGKVIAIDRDEEILNLAKKRCKDYLRRVIFIKENFKNLPLILTKMEIDEVDGLLLDLGVSTLQLLKGDRGFSLLHNGPLDMRMDKSQEIDARYLVNTLSEEKLAKIFREYGEEKKADIIAKAIVEERRFKTINTTRELVEIVLRVKPIYKRQKIHPATKVFMALRIAVNGELDGLDRFLINFIKNNLKSGGRVIIISFHSLEDRIIKRTFNLLAGKCVCGLPADLCRCPREKIIKILKPFPLKPSFNDVKENRRMRSAKLRGVEKL